MSEINDEYTVLVSEGKSLHKAKGSKHFGYATYAESIEEVEQFLNRIRKEHYAARHVCYAYSIEPKNPKQKYTDDGEPHNSAGPPILGQINSFKISNCVVAVVRYFGGTKLGVGGLISAYKTAAQEAIEHASKEIRYHKKEIKIYFGYNDMSIIMRLAKQHGIEIKAQKFESQCQLIIDIREKYFMDFCGKLDKLHTITYKT